MADGQQRALTTAFAPPPPLWKHFTPDNLKKLEQIKKEASKGEDGKPQKKKWTAAELRSLDLPPELRLLVPPDIPTSGQYSVFGEVQNLSTALPELKDQGITQLYPSSGGEADREPSSEPARPLNHAYYLLKISKSLLLNFLEFVGVLSITPEQYESKVEDLRNLFVNAHHLLNLYRPHQARESLITMMEEQLSRTREEIQEMDKLKAEVTSALDRLKSQGIDVDAAVDEETRKATAAAEPPQDKSKLIWDLLDDAN
ncbi:mediator complex subunit MED7 [Aspergillus candidus]|uniref:Mediator of RNA polymerase II transcription subunit 7 n=1 Tax=Aspergillus candidus TaxID=41067 RepID=A0A2I2FKZ2_ASPCN|nr:mediator of RNA polymerase II transcription subunit 7 [Aspergillus candidus]PLB41282.1 mediator of RNA polymerase II transcription subunit 7 [Aspergillus candidus]